MNSEIGHVFLYVIDSKYVIKWILSLCKAVEGS